MASKVFEEYLKKASPEEKTALQQTGQDLQRNGVQVKEDPYGPQNPARIGESRPHAAPPKLDEGMVQGQKRENAFDRALALGEKAQTQEQSQQNQKKQELER